MRERESERERKRAKRARESEREAVQSSLGLLCRSKTALYVLQLLRFGVVRWDGLAVVFVQDPIKVKELRD